MRKRFAPLLALAACAAFVGAGCGDDDDETTTTAATGATGATGGSGAALLPDDFIAEADAVCRQGDNEIDAAVNEAFGGGGEPSNAEQESFIEDTVLPSIRDQIDGLRDLGEPEEGAEEWSAFLDDAEAATDEVVADPSLFRDQTQGGPDPFADVNQQAEDLGLRECAG